MNISEYYSATNIYVVEQVDLPVNSEDLKEEWLLVKYEEQKFLGEVMCVKYKDVQVCCLQISYVILELQEFECKEDAIFYKQVFRNNELPKMMKNRRKWLWSY